MKVVNNRKYRHQLQKKKELKAKKGDKFQSTLQKMFSFFSTHNLPSKKMKNEKVHKTREEESRLIDVK